MDCGREKTFEKNGEKIGQFISVIRASDGALLKFGASVVPE
jgi:hypothetical protein